MYQRKSQTPGELFRTNRCCYTGKSRKHAESKTCFKLTRLLVANACNFEQKAAEVQTSCCKLALHIATARARITTHTDTTYFTQNKPMKPIVSLEITLYNQNAFALFSLRPIRWKQHTSPKPAKQPITTWCKKSSNINKESP